MQTWGWQEKGNEDSNEQLEMWYRDSQKSDFWPNDTDCWLTDIITVKKQKRILLSNMTQIKGLMHGNMNFRSNVFLSNVYTINASTILAED